MKVIFKWPRSHYGVKMSDNTNIIKHNAEIWDKQAKSQCAWSIPVSSKVINNAKKGTWQIHITKKPIPTNWLPLNIKGKDILCLASGGGQQAPVLAAAGANVTVVDASIKQLEQDDFVAKRDNLSLTTIQCDMRDLSQISNACFDYIIHPISNLYIPDLTDLWKECYRVLKIKGLLLASFYNPALFIFDRDDELTGKGLLRPKFKLPYSALKDNKNINNSEEAITFGHTLSEQISKQIDAGFAITGFYEDDHPSPRFLIESFMQTMIATKAVKL